MCIKLVLLTDNRQSHTGFWLVLTSVTLNGITLPVCTISALAELLLLYSCGTNSRNSLLQSTSSADIIVTTVKAQLNIHYIGQFSAITMLPIHFETFTLYKFVLDIGHQTFIVW